MKQHEGAKMFGGSYFGGSGLISKKYLLYDTFMTDRAAGSVDGTPAEPGPGGRRLIRDVESKISIVGGVETWAAQATPVYAEQDRVYDQLAVTRAFGVVVICKWRLTTDNPVYPLAFVTSKTPTWNHTHVEAGFYRSAALSLAVICNATLGPVVAAIAADTDYLLAIELRAAGEKGYIKGGAFTNWTKLFECTLGSTATLYVASAGYTAVFTLDDVRLPSRLFKDAPLASDSFAGADGSMTGRVTDGLGHPEANGGAGLAWATPGNTWTIASNAAVNTPTQGAELLTDGGLENWNSATDLTSWTEITAGTSTVNREGTVIHGGTFASRHDIDAGSDVAAVQQVLSVAVGDWVMLSAWMRASAAGKQNAIQIVNGATPIVNYDFGTVYAQGFFSTRISSTPVTVSLSRGAGSASGSLYFDDIIAKKLTLSTLFSSLVLSTVNIMAECVIKTLVAGTQAGGVARLNNAATPTRGIIYYWDGAGNVKVDEFTAAATWTNLLNVVKAYATGDKLRPWLNGSAWRLYHCTAAGVCTLLGSGTTTVLTGNLFGNFSTYSGNAIESCVVYPTGIEGQWDALNQF